MTLPVPAKTGCWFVYDCVESSAKVERRADGTFYGMTCKFDFVAADETELRDKLMRWGFTKFVGLDEKPR